MTSPIAPGDCDCCQGGADRDRLLQHKINQHGWGVVGVTDQRRPFAYTVGLTPAGLPELYLEVLIPQMLDQAQRWLNEAAQHLTGIDGELPEELTLGGHPFTASPLANLKPLAMARRFYPGLVRALHLKRA